jgi:hypothetical protein
LLITNIKALLISATLALVSLPGMAASVSAQENQAKDPFEVSKQNCIDKSWIGKTCITTNEKMGRSHSNSLLMI